MIASSPIKKLASEKEWLLWGLLILFQIGTLINLAFIPYTPLIPAFAILLVILASAFFYPKILLAQVVIAIVASEELYFDVGPVVVRVIDMMVLVAGAFIFIKWLLNPKSQIENVPIFKIALGLILFMAIVSLVGTISLDNSLLEILQIIELIAAAILFFNLIKSESDIKLVLSTLLVYSILDATWIIFQYWRGDLAGRHVGLFYTLANELSYGVAISVGFFHIVKRNWLRFVILMSGALQISAIYLTRGRGLLITALIMAIACALFFAISRKRLLSFILSTSVILLACFISFLAFSPDIQARYASLIEGGQMRDLRLIMWAVALKVWQHYPLLGVGVGNIELVSVQFTPKPIGIAMVALGEKMKGPHNEYLNFAMQAGWIGFITGILLHNPSVECNKGIFKKPIKI